MRFSLRMIISGAFKSINFLRRLLRLMTRRYKSFKSEVAKRPPSSGTKGRRSGGITGMTSKTIHSALFPDILKSSTIFRVFAIFLAFVPAGVAFSISFRSFLHRDPRSISFRNSLTASAPILALNAPPYFTNAS